VFFEIATDDNLETKYVVPRANTDRARIPDLLNDPRTLIGLSDAGAHVDMFAEAGYTTYMLGHWVREKRALSIEAAVKRITADPADYFGFRDRGRLMPGAAADIVVLDADRVGSPERASLVRDLPANGARMVPKASCKCSSTARGCIAMAGTPAIFRARCCVRRNEKYRRNGRRGEDSPIASAAGIPATAL
jgi:N-acyl-D-amino-acid deacylase